MISIEIPILNEINKKLDVVMRALKLVLANQGMSEKREIQMTIELDELQAAVEENTTVDQSIMTLVDGLAAKIEALKDDPARLAALAKSLRDSSAMTVAKVLANTEAEPPTPEV